MTPPSALDAIRAEALAKFESLDWPARNEENWRFGSWKEANLSGLEPVGAGSGTELPDALEGTQRFVFHNAELISGSADSVQLLADAPELLPQTESRLGSPKLSALHRSQSTHGLILKTSKNESIEIIHVVSGEGLLTPTVVIIADDGAKVRVVERFISANESDAATVLCGADLIAGEGTKVTYLVTQELNANSKLIRLADSRLEALAHAKQAVIHTGAKWVREETYSTVDGMDARSEILSVAVPTTGQEYDQRTFQHHGARDTHSDLLFKNTLFGKAKTIFSGLIFVDEGAHGTDAYQTCRNLMMTDDCEANSMPGLEINADDVKCSHGSTASRVSDEEIFYLQARGIDAKSARNLVAQGFSIEAIEKLEDEQFETLATEIVARKFAAID
ncbi:SufD family Fe-S cluster assembly protein [Akkermansiaceae bacterium]|nr:SufD family Fe-S cluster assembly protein [Akkermansiaceae bacterium]MDB4537315.1 SufD family Fe-S cluster assembly protein [Akkermansiaceae bacterium]